jgi:hypothetical protein
MQIDKPGGHKDQMIRQTRAHLVQLSQMADMKANILITASSLVITLSLRFITDSRLLWPTLVLLIGMTATAVLAAHAAMPKLRLRRRKAKPRDPSAVDFNLLFFGHFIDLSYERYEAEMEKVLQDDNATYEVQVREVYAMGQYLAKEKYRWVTYAYLSFTSGIVAAAITFAGSVLL